MSLNHNKNIESQSSLKIEQELSRILTAIFESNKKVMQGLNEVKTINGWFNEAKQDPHVIPSIILNECVKTIIKYVQPVLDKYLIDTFDIKTRTKKGEVIIDPVKIKFSIKPFVEFSKIVDGNKIGGAKIVFEMALTGKGEKIQFRQVKNHGQTTVGKISTSFDLSILHSSITYQNEIINPIKKQSIKLYHKEVLILENLVFVL